MAQLSLGNAVKTTNISKEEAEKWLSDLYKHTDEFIKSNFKWHVKEQMWPIKARVPDAADPDPNFIVNHHTSNKQRNFKPALYRFLSAKMASANFLVGDGVDDLLYLVKVQDQSFHATVKTFLPLTIKRALEISGGWLKVPGIEVAGNGNFKLFTYFQFLNVIVLQRYLVSYYNGSVKELKSHRFFNPIDRSGDPGPLYFLPLVEHAVLNNINLMGHDYWLEEYRKDPIAFANEGYKKWFDKYNLWEKDEWKDKRRKLKVNSSHLV